MDLDRIGEDLLIFCAERSGLSYEDCMRVFDAQSDFWTARIRQAHLAELLDDAQEDT